MANKLSDALPSLTPDKDQVSAYKNTRTHLSPKGKKQEKSPQSSTSNTLSTVLILVLGGIGFWWFYQQDIRTQTSLRIAEHRIAELEQQLSATGEEIGESAGAMKVRLELLSKKTSDLWLQMDKLWASAWRRNQSDIATLNVKTKTFTTALSKQKKQASITQVALKNISQKQSEVELNIGILAEQLQSTQALKTQLLELSSSLATLQSQDLSRDKQQIKLASNLVQLQTTQTKLATRIQQLESQLATASKTVITVPVT